MCLELTLGSGDALGGQLEGGKQGSPPGSAESPGDGDKRVRRGPR